MSGPLAQVTERLYADFRTHATLRQVIAVVRRCADELDTPSQEAVPELVERLARQRLTDLADTSALNPAQPEPQNPTRNARLRLPIRVDPDADGWMLIGGVRGSPIAWPVSINLPERRCPDSRGRGGRRPGGAVRRLR